MNICFISNYSKTDLHMAIADALAEKGIQSFWIACNRKIYHQLILKYGDCNVLLLNTSRVKKTEEVLGDFKLNELVFGDRVLRKDKKKAQIFLRNIQKPIYTFLRNNSIRKVYGEVTWAHELLIHRMCIQLKDLDCQYLNPHVVRIPNNRFAFFTDEKQSQLLEKINPQKKTYETLTPKPPTYLKINKNILDKANSAKGKLSKMKKFLRTFVSDDLDPTLLTNPRTRIKKAAMELWNCWQYKMIKKSQPKLTHGMNYLFLGLHKQPEASVDVLGRYYEDQYQNIVNLWRALPEGWHFIIKEHSIAVGDRSRSFYKKIKSLPGVILMDEKAPTYELLMRAKLVATVSGTIAYEAALMGIPSITFAPTFFNQLNVCQQVNLETLDKHSLSNLVEILKASPRNEQFFTDYLYSSSFPGNVLDPVTDPKVLSAENIQLLTKAFYRSIFQTKNVIKTV